MSFAEKLQESAAKYVFEICIAVATVVGIAIVDFLVPDRVLDQIGRNASGRLVLGLCLALAICVATLFYLWPRLRFEKASGTYADRKGTHYCPVCLVDRRKRMPMLEKESG